MGKLKAGTQVCYLSVCESQNRQVAL